MAYKVNFFDPNTTPIDVEDGTLNNETHLVFVGKNWYGYGETIAENQLRLLENHAYSPTDSDPHPLESKAVEGQIYYNKQKDIYYYFYKDSTKIQNNTNYNGEWRAMAGSTMRIFDVKDTSLALHTVTVGYDITDGNNDIVFTISSEDDFQLHDSEEEFINQGFTHIRKGITLSSSTGMKFHGTATSAQYADLAEMYHSDANYEPGTVLKIGGEAEVTQTTTAFDPGVFGIVSTDPAYLMNSAAEGTVVPVALAGRVPCKVIGPVKKGQRLLSSEEPGVARAPTDYEMQEYMDWYRIVGRAIEDKTTEGIGLVEVVVGAK